MPGIKELYIGKSVHNGHEHEEKHVNFYPKEIFCIEDENGEKVFFVPISALHDDSKKYPLPIYLCNFTSSQRTKIVVCGEIKGMEISFKHFTKPLIYINYDESHDDGSGLLLFPKK
jgi:hypothetical protein